MMECSCKGPNAWLDITLHFDERLTVVENDLTKIEIGIIVYECMMPFMNFGI